MMWNRPQLAKKLAPQIFIVLALAIILSVVSASRMLLFGGTNTADLAFETVDGGIFVAQLDGSGGNEIVRICSPERGDITALSLAPDGRYLAFACGLAQDGHQSGLYLVEIASRRSERITEEVLDRPDSLLWSPDSRHLAYLIPRDIGPAPHPALELFVYDRSTGNHAKINGPQYFVGGLAWEPDGAALVFHVGSLHHSSSPVITYRAQLDGGEATPVSTDFAAIVPGPSGLWLGICAPRNHHHPGSVCTMAMDGTVLPVSAPSVPPGDNVEHPLGWVGPDPVIWRQTIPTTEGTRGRGEVWRLGRNPERLLSDVPQMDAGLRSAAMFNEQLLYVEDDGAVWLVNLTTKERRKVGEHARPLVSMRGAP